MKNMNLNNIINDSIIWKVCSPHDLKYNFSNNLSMFQKCLLQTHIDIYNYIVINDIDYALIIEDNVTFMDNWKDIINNFKEKNFSFIYISNNNYKNNNIDNKKWFISPAYIITKETSEKLLNSDSVNFLDNEHKILSKIRSNIYSYYPSLIQEINIPN